MLLPSLLYVDPPPEGANINYYPHQEVGVVVYKKFDDADDGRLVK